MVEFFVGTGRFTSVIQPLEREDLSDREIALLAPVDAYAFCTFVLEHEEAFTPRDTPEDRRRQDVSHLRFLGGEILPNRLLVRGVMGYSSGSRVIRTSQGVLRNIAREDRFIDLP